MADAGRRAGAEMEDGERKERPDRFFGRVLVVIDKPVDQWAAVLMLERLGCRADAAPGGREAVEMTRASHYDAVLIECEMPEMSGLEAAVAIRVGSGDGRRIPIIAMTANEAPGDRGRFLRAGVDDHIRKPVTLEDLRAVLRRWLSPAAGAALDRAALGRIEDLTGKADPALMEQVFRHFEQNCVERLEALREAEQAGDVGALRSAAHAIKGACAHIGAFRMAKVAHRLQALGYSGTIKGAGEMIERLHEEFRRVVLEIQCHPAAERGGTGAAGAKSWRARPA